MADQVLPPGLKEQKRIQISGKRGLLVAVLGRREHVRIHGYSILSGITVAEVDESPWWRTDYPVPEGNYTLFRANESGVDAFTDFAGSKSIWHARLGCGGIVMSTCLEMIVALLGDFSVDDRALGWFLSSGTCGPRRSWDRRVKPMPRNTQLRTRKVGEAIVVRESQLDRPQQFVAAVDAPLLQREMDRTLAECSLGDKPWLLALSGGCDSRAMLHGTKRVENLTCVTWADEQTLDLPNSDLAVARSLAEQSGREHIVKIIKRPADAAALDDAMRRFVRYSDGRVDNVLAYVDGMQIWDDLSASDARGLLRGDELFGSVFATRNAQILQNMRLISFSDYAGGVEQNALAARHNHATPAGLLRRSGESTTRWRSRLRADYEIPTVYAALNAVRTRFVEDASPFLARSLVVLAGSMSDKDMDDKALYTELVAAMYPEIPFATERSILKRTTFLAMPQSIELLLDHLCSDYARDVLGSLCAASASQAILKIREQQEIPAAGKSSLVLRKPQIPVWVKRLKRHLNAPPELQLPVLGMRSYLASLVHEEMTKAANLGAQTYSGVRRAIA